MELYRTEDFKLSELQGGAEGEMQGKDTTWGKLDRCMPGF